MPEMDYDKATRLQYDDSSLSVGESVYSRKNISSTGLSTASGSLRMAFFTAGRTETISQIRVISGGTAAGATPTLIRIGVYQVDDATQNLTLVASTPNDTALLAATNTVYTKSLSVPFVKYKGTRYAVGLVIVTAAATPTLVGNNGAPASEAFVAPHMAAYSAQTDLPATITDASLTSGASIIYFALLP